MASLLVTRVNVEVDHTCDDFIVVGVKVIAAVRGSDDGAVGVQHAPAEVLFFVLH